MDIDLSNGYTNSPNPAHLHNLVMRAHLVVFIPAELEMYRVVDLESSWKMLSVEL